MEFCLYLTMVKFKKNPGSASQPSEKKFIEVRRQQFSVISLTVRQGDKHPWHLPWQVHERRTVYRQLSAQPPHRLLPLKKNLNHFCLDCHSVCDNVYRSLTMSSALAAVCTVYRLRYRNCLNYITLHYITYVTSCAGDRHNIPPPPVTLTFDLLTLKVVSESHVTWATSVPILVFLGLSVLDLGPMYAKDVRRQTDVRQHHRLMPRLGDGGIINV